jgi:hypothetical protein
LNISPKVCIISSTIINTKGNALGRRDAPGAVLLAAAGQLGDLFRSADQGDSKR